MPESSADDDQVRGQAHDQVCDEPPGVARKDGLLLPGQPALQLLGLFRAARLSAVGEKARPIACGNTLGRVLQALSKQQQAPLLSPV